MAERDPFDYLADEFVRATQDSGAFRLEIVAKDQEIERLKDENVHLRHIIRALVMNHSPAAGGSFAIIEGEEMLCTCQCDIAPPDQHGNIAISVDTHHPVTKAPVVKP